MATSRPFAYNTGSPIDGTQQVGDIAIGWPADGFRETGLEWWNGPDEDLGYVIAKPVPSDTQPTPVHDTASIAFSRTNGFDDNEFIGIANLLTGNTYLSASAAKTGLNNAGFWTSYSGISLIMDLNSTIGVSGSTWSDSSGYGNNANLVGGVDTTTANGYQVVRLNGTDGYIYPPAGFSTILDSGFTYEVWVLSAPSPTTCVLIGEWGGTVPNGWTDAQMAFVGGYINTGVYPAGAFSGIGYIQGPSSSTLTWYNIVMTYDGTTLTQYVNGISTGSVTGTKANPGNTYLTLGRDDNAGSYLGGASGYFRGLVGSWRIWDGALSGSQILSNFNSTKSRFGL